MSVSILFLACNSTQLYECLYRVPSYATIHYLPIVDAHCSLAHLMKLYLASMSSSSNLYLYKPCDVFTMMGRCSVLEDEFSYPINLNLRNTARVLVTL